MSGTSTDSGNYPDNFRVRMYIIGSSKGLSSGPFCDSRLHKRFVYKFAPIVYLTKSTFHDDITAVQG